jgi:gliding motility-associated-like protein
MNGTPPYILDAGDGFQDADTLFNLNAGNYILTVTDDNGCTATLPFTIFDGAANEEADITFAIDGIPCEGGTVAVLYQGMPIPPNIGVVWSTGEVNDTIVITGTDTLGVDILVTNLNCFLNDTVHINCMVQVDLDITVMQPLCGEGALGGPYTGTVIADTINATGAVTWYWSFGDTTTTGIYSGLSPGKYYVTVVDGLDSTAVDSFEIIPPPTLGFDFSHVDSTSCPGTCDGGVQILPLDGDPTMDYFLYWDPVNPKADTGIFFGLMDLCPGINVFTLSQDGNCFFVDSIEIFAPDSVRVDLVQATDVSCYGLADGSLEVNASGGTPGYTYTWENGPPTPVYTGLTAGYHAVIVTDSRNCAVEDSFLIAQPDTLIADIDSSATFHLSCGASDDGVITVEVSGGNLGGYTYTWNPDVSSAYQAVNLSAGNYNVTVSDVRGCSDTTSFLLSSPPPVVVAWPVLIPPACFGDESEFAIESVMGGSGVYQYTINSGEIHEIDEVVNLPAGIFIISVFDDRGCEADTTYTIMQPNPIMVSIGPDDPVIDLGDSLYITGTILQSDNPIATTLWTSEEPLSCETCEGTWVFNSFPTLYTWTVTDINGCTGSASILVDVDYDRDVFLPNIFSPNSDGRNDDFTVFTGPGVETINYIRIYDRWGNVVHTESGLLPSQTGAGNWDGTFDGQEMNPGVYVYVVEIKFIDGQTLVFRGDVTLVK